MTLAPVLRSQCNQFVAQPDKLFWEPFFWLMAKCMFSLLSYDKQTHRHCYRLCELFPCYVREIFAFKWVLTSVAFRLNNRDNFREMPSSNTSSNAFQLESIRRNENSYATKTRPTAVGVTMHSTVTADTVTSKHAYGNEQEFDKSVRILHTVEALWG